MDYGSGKATYRLVDHFRFRVQHWFERYAHWCATFNNPLPQGLGTGMLFTDNIEVPLEIRKDCLWFCK